MQFPQVSGCLAVCSKAKKPQPSAFPLSPKPYKARPLNLTQTIETRHRYVSPQDTWVACFSPFFRSGITRKPRTFDKAFSDKPQKRTRITAERPVLASKGRGLRLLDQEDVRPEEDDVEAGCQAESAPGRLELASLLCQILASGGLGSGPAGGGLLRSTGFGATTSPAPSCTSPR